MKYKITVVLADNAEEVYECEYPSSHVSITEGPQGYRITQEARQPGRDHDGDPIWEAKSWSTVYYPTHRVKKIVSTQW